ncbi:hypothetical protein KC19_1G290100 [Ceratodon purpureus]|uniref:Uncharacterized protein n=1 Tax=Ceratodon purpureus TaxID=3225 RepID=A0A8T0JAY7_CERPU|nr:hypothetical protein KC19_1G290100 [Ceratodon purpureus]
MNTSQLDQAELWRFVIEDFKNIRKKWYFNETTGELEGYDRIAARFRPGSGGGGHWVRDFLFSSASDDASSSRALLKAGTSCTGIS